jgi:hypothetical protein
MRKVVVAPASAFVASLIIAARRRPRSLVQVEANISREPTNDGRPRFAGRRLCVGS